MTSNPQLYKKWFGQSYARYSGTVKGNYLDVKSAMETHTYTLYFHGWDCEEGDYVTTARFCISAISCDLYFSAPITGMDSKADTIVHEMTHTVAYTEDYEYGIKDCLKLAARNPSRAVKNADNYAYFAEAAQI